MVSRHKRRPTPAGVVTSVVTVVGSLLLQEQCACGDNIRAMHQKHTYISTHTAVYAFQ